MGLFQSRTTSTTSTQVEKSHPQVLSANGTSVNKTNGNEIAAIPTSEQKDVKGLRATKPLFPKDLVKQPQTQQPQQSVQSMQEQQKQQKHQLATIKPFGPIPFPYIKPFTTGMTSMTGTIQKSTIPLKRQSRNFPKFLDWTKIKLNSFSSYTFPRNFVFGTSIAEYQNSGKVNVPFSNWGPWENQIVAHAKNKSEQILNSGESRNHIKFYETDIDLTKALGLNGFRFDLNWALLEPHEGKFNDQAILYYKKKLKYLRQNGIIPMITLHHFVHPQWFEAKGAFENKENIKYFVRFSRKMMELYGDDHIGTWATFNEPNIYASSGYIRSAFPPGYLGAVKRCGVVMENLGRAHIETYRALKAIKPEAQIGIVMQYLLFEPFHSPFLGNSIYPDFRYSIESNITKTLTHIMTDAFWKFLKTGHLDLEATPMVLASMFKSHAKGPQLGDVESFMTIWPERHVYTDFNFPKSLDWIGLNYYSRIWVDIQQPSSPAIYPGHLKTDMWYSVYAEGLYGAVEEMSTLGVPIYITETGLADNQNKMRAEAIKRTMYVLSCVLRDGYDVRGLFWWSLMDNFEWDEGFVPKFGLYDENRKLKPGSEWFKRIIENAKRY